MNSTSAAGSIPAISMTTFLDFVQASGRGRLSAILRAKAQYDARYQPATDYYKGLRERIQAMHQQSEPSSVLNQFLSDLDNSRKERNYRQCVRGYQAWLGRRQARWLGKSSRIWTSGDLRVKVNPELGLELDGERYRIKLYFKENAAIRSRLEAMLRLLEVTMPASEGIAPAILDVPRGRLIQLQRAQPGLDALLAGEAAAFLTMWRAT